MRFDFCLRASLGSHTDQLITNLLDKNALFVQLLCRPMWQRLNDANTLRNDDVESEGQNLYKFSKKIIKIGFYAK